MSRSRRAGDRHGLDARRGPSVPGAPGMTTVGGFSSCASPDGWRTARRSSGRITAARHAHRCSDWRDGTDAIGRCPDRCGRDCRGRLYRAIPGSDRQADDGSGWRPRNHLSSPLAGSTSSLEDMVPLKVIGAGLGRTGTLSLKTALEQLWVCRVLSHDRGPRPTRACPGLDDAAARGESVDWEDLFPGLPGDGRLARLHLLPQNSCGSTPTRRVILTVRDPRAVGTTARPADHLPRPDRLPRLWLPPFVPRMRHLRTMLDRLVWVGMFKGAFRGEALRHRGLPATQRGGPARPSLPTSCSSTR